MWNRWTQFLELSSRYFGLFRLSVALVSIVLFVASISNPWLIGVQKKTYCSWAVGSGRLKIWIAEPTQFSNEHLWTNSWFRGLDGQPIRWDFTIPTWPTGGIVVIAIPLWAIAAVSGSGGVYFICTSMSSRRLEQRDRSLSPKSSVRRE